LLNTILGSLSSGVAASTNSYESIATTTVGSGGSANVTFSSIPSTYTHLQIRSIGRTTQSATASYIEIEMNSDTGSNYSFHILQGDGSSAVAGSLSSQTKTYARNFTAANAGASTFGAIIIDILDYANTNKYKTIRNLGGTDNNGSGTINLTSGLWMSTSAITSIKFTPESGNFAQYSQFALYGIKGA
jgi:hypothetical protein